jgi:cytochrome c-type biogenesis protein CcmH
MKVFRAASTEAWIFLAVSFIGLIGLATFADGGPVSSEERIQSLAGQYACPTCRGQSVAESNAAVASTIREFIRTEVSAGASDTDIRDALIRAYGGEVLLTPPSDGVATLIWVLPVLVIVGGFALVFSSVWRSRAGPGPPEPTADDEALVESLRRDR